MHSLSFQESHPKAQGNLTLSKDWCWFQWAKDGIFHRSWNQTQILRNCVLFCQSQSTKQKLSLNPKLFFSFEGILFGKNWTFLYTISEDTSQSLHMKVYFLFNIYHNLVVVFGLHRLSNVPNLDYFSQNIRKMLFSGIPFDTNNPWFVHSRKRLAYNDEYQISFCNREKAYPNIIALCMFYCLHYQVFSWILVYFLFNQEFYIQWFHCLYW